MQPGQDSSEGSSLSQQANLRAKIDLLEEAIADLKTEYELFFSGLQPLPPDKMHQQVVRTIRELERAPFKATSLQYRMRALRSRYNTYDSYIQRVLREREAGTYSRDVFKADLRDKKEREVEKLKTEAGRSERRLKELFISYKDAVEKVGGATELSFDVFKESLIKRSKELRSKTGSAKVNFAIVEEGGEVNIKITSR